jgi:hypothetical protein
VGTDRDRKETQMPHSRYTDDEIVRRGEELYDQQIRPQVEPGNKGKFLVLDIETGEYEIDADSRAAFDRADAKRPDPPLYILRIGFPTAVRIGGRSLVSRP